MVCEMTARDPEDASAQPALFAYKPLGQLLDAPAFLLAFEARLAYVEDPSQRGERWKYVHLRDNTG